MNGRCPAKRMVQMRWERSRKTWYLLQIEGGVGFREHGNTVRGWREKVVICKDLEE